MQRIMTHTTGKSIFLQSAEIFQNATVSLLNKNGEKISSQKMIKTNYLPIEGKHPKGEYHVVVKEDGNEWKRSVYLGS